MHQKEPELLQSLRSLWEGRRCLPGASCATASLAGSCVLQNSSLCQGKKNQKKPGSGHTQPSTAPVLHLCTEQQQHWGCFSSSTSQESLPGEIFGSSAHPCVGINVEQIFQQEYPIPGEEVEGGEQLLTKLVCASTKASTVGFFLVFNSSRR